MEITLTDAQESDRTPKKATQTNGGKQGIGATGVHLHYHTPDEYTALTRPQRTELEKWRLLHLTLPKTAPKKRKQTSIATAVAKGVSNAMEEAKNEKKDAETSKAAPKALIISAFDEEPGKPTARKVMVGSMVTPSKAETPNATVSPSSF